MSKNEITTWDELPLVLSVSETSRILRFSLVYVRKMCREKEIPCFHQGMRIRIPKEGLKRYLENLNIEKSHSVV